MNAEIPPLIVGTGTQSRIEIRMGEIERYSPSVHAQVSIMDRWIHVQHQQVWLDRTALKQFVDQVGAWARLRESGARLEGMSPEAFTLDFDLQGQARNIRVRYSLQTIAPDAWGPIIHAVSGTFDLNMEYLLLLIDDVRQMFMQLERAWAVE
ncbi:MAG TPA: hypothetical protein VGE07_12095 [Herpetosiphonaceae bacterium]